jgi:hypothetical protein
MTIDAAAFIQRHPRHGHPELVVDFYTTRASAALLAWGDRIITSDIVVTLEDAAKAGLTIIFHHKGR